MKRRSMAVGAALAVALLATAIAWPVYGRHAFLVALEILAPLGVVTALVADAIAGRPAWLGGLRGQLAALAALVALQLAAAVALFAELMFVSNHDAFFMSWSPPTPASSVSAPHAWWSSAHWRTWALSGGRSRRWARAAAMSASRCTEGKSSRRSRLTSSRWSGGSPPRSVLAAS